MKRVAAVIAGVFALVCAGMVEAQPRFPAFSPRPITIVLAFPPGASADSNMRMVTQKVTEQTGQAFVIKNMAGGAGTVAAVAAKRAPADGLTLLQATLTTMATNQYLSDEKPYDLQADFRAVTKLWSLPLLAMVPAANGVTTLAGLVDLAKKKPGGLSYSSTGVHTVPHFLGALLSIESGAPMVHVPYSGASTAISDLVANRIDLYFVSWSPVMSFAANGDLRALAVADPRRLAAAPDVPTTIELGFPGVALPAHWGLLAPAGTPDDAIARLNEMFARALDDPDIRKLTASQGTELVSSTPAEFEGMIAAEFVNLRRILAATGMGRK